MIFRSIHGGAAFVSIAERYEDLICVPVKLDGVVEDANGSLAWFHRRCGAVAKSEAASKVGGQLVGACDELRLRWTPTNHRGARARTTQPTGVLDFTLLPDCGCASHPDWPERSRHTGGNRRGVRRDSLAGILFNRIGQITLVGWLVVALVDLGVMASLLSVGTGLTVDSLPAYDLMLAAVVIAASILGPTSAIVVSAINIILICGDFFVQPHAPDLVTDLAGYPGISDGVLALLGRPVGLHLIITVDLRARLQHRLRTRP